MFNTNFSHEDSGRTAANTTPLPGAAPQHQAELESYIASGYGFVCEFARQAYLHKAISIVELGAAVPVLPTPAYELGLIEATSSAHLIADERVNAIQDVLYGALGPFLNGKKAAAIFIENPGPTTHEQAQAKAWSMYSELAVAMFRLENPGALAEQIRPHAIDRARYFSEPDNIPDFLGRGLLEYKGQPLHFIVMNPLYPTTPYVHPRYSPAHIYVLTREEDVINATENSPKIIEPMLHKVLNNAAPYTGLLPYIMQGDDRYLDASFVELRNNLSEIQRKSAGNLQGNPHDMALAVVAHVTQMKLAAKTTGCTVKLNSSALAGVLHKAGYLQCSPEEFVQSNL